MNTTKTRAGEIRILAALIGTACAGMAVAQQQPLDTQGLSATRVQTASCAEVAWDRELLASYPRIAEACQEVIVSEGDKWARFAADFVSRNRDGTVTLDFKDRQGRSIESLNLMPGEDQRVRIEGRDYRFSELDRGQELNLYVPEGIFAIAIEPGAPAAQLVPVVRQPAQLAQAETTSPRALAQPTSPRAQAVQRLPDTAGPLPLLLVGGLASLLGGLGLTIRRRFGAKGGRA